MEQRSEKGIKALEYLFQHPCFWNFQTIGSFYQTTDKFLKDTKRKEWDAKQNGNNRIAGKSIWKFIEQMNNTALKTNVFGSGNTGWKSVLDKHDKTHYEYLATSYYANGSSEELEYDGKLITQLLTILRHKWEHLRHVPKNIKIILKWVIKDNDAPEGQLSVQYFTTLFPDVLPFLWKQFFEHRRTSELRPFYAGLKEDQRIEDLPGNINDLLRMIGNALVEDLKEGNVDSYFESKKSRLDCRTMSLPSINNILWNSSSLSILIKIGTNQVDVWWQGSSLEPMKYVCEQTELENCSIVISNDFTKLDKGLLDKCKSSKKVIALGSVDSSKEVIREQFEEVLGKLVEHEFEWKDFKKLDPDFAQKLLEGIIQVQGVGMPLSSILPKNVQNRTNVLSGLKGSLLCKFLSSQTMPMFDRPKQPVINTPYIERTLTPRISADLNVLNRVKESESDIVIVSGITFQKLKELLGEETKILKTSEKNFYENQICRIFYTKLSYDSYEDMLEGEGKIAKLHLTRKHVHCLKFENERLVWLGTNECHTLPNPILVDLNFKDNDWLRNASLENLPRVTCLSDKLGMGKSTILGKFAKVIKERFPSFIIVLIDIEDFKNKIINLPLTKQNVLNVLLQLICKSEFETKVAMYWLGYRGIQNTLNFQIMFDGLNEFSEQAQHLVVEAIKVINTSLLSVRVLITTHDNTRTSALCNIEQVAILHLKPFSRSDSIRYLTESWMAAASAGGRNVSHEITKNIELLAEHCVDANNSKLLRESVDLAGTPLFCYMLAKIFEEIALAGHANCELDSWENITSVRFFETLFIKLAQTYINKKFQSSIKDNDSMVNIIHQDMMKKHTYFALMYLISKNAANEFKNRLAFTDIESSLKDITDFGIIKSVKPLQFVSKIFPGFLVASFFIQVINGTHGTAFSIEDAWFRKAMWNNVLKIQDPILSLGYVNCRNSTIAYFMDAYISQISSGHLIFEESKVCIDKLNDKMTLKANMFLNLFHEEIKEAKRLNLSNLFDVTLTAKFPLRHLFCFAIGCGQTGFCERAFIANGPLRHEIFRKKPCSLIEFIVRTVTEQYDKEYVKYTPTKDIKILLPHLKKKGFPGLTNIKCGKALWKLIVQGDIRKKVVREWIRFIVEQLSADVNNIVDVHESRLLHVVMRKAIKANTTREFKLYCNLWKYLLDKGAEVRENIWGMTAFAEALQMFRNENRLSFHDELQYYSSFIRDDQFSDSLFF